MAAWLEAINDLIQKDVRQDRLPIFYQPTLHVLGKVTTPLPGRPVPHAVGDLP